MFPSEKMGDDSAESQKRHHVQTGTESSSSPLLRLVRRAFRRETWTREALSIVSSVGVVGITSGVLYLFDNQPFSSWRAPFSLNAFLSAAVSVLYLLIMSAVSSCILQLRWLHFRTKNPLSDFQAFDRVNHGPFQSLALLLSPLTSIMGGDKPGKLWRSKEGVLINYAAFLVILVAAIGPLTQLLLDQTTVRLPISFDAALSVATSLTDNPMREDASTYEMFVLGDVYNAKIVSHIFSGAFLSEPLEFNVPAECPTGNCTWNDYASFMVRSQVKNMTSSVMFADNATVRDAFVNGLNFNASADTSAPLVWLPGSSNSSVLLNAGFMAENVLKFDLNKSSSIGDKIKWDMRLYLSSPVTNIFDGSDNFNNTRYETHIYYQNLAMEGIATSTGLSNASITYGKTAAWDCSFDIVLQPYEANKTNGAFFEQPVGDPIELNGSSCTIPEPTIDNLGPDCAVDLKWRNSTFPLGAQFTGGVVVSLDMFLSGLVFMRNSSSTKPNGRAGNGSNNSTVSPDIASFAYSLATSEVFPDDLKLKDFDAGFGIEGMITNIATALTAGLRKTSGTTAPGTVQRSTVIYVVSWAWMAVPVALVLLTSGLLLFTALETRRQGVPAWIDSTLAIMVHGVDEQTRQELATLSGAEKLEDACRDVQVRFRGIGLMRGNAG